MLRKMIQFVGKLIAVSLVCLLIGAFVDKSYLVEVPAEGWSPLHCLSSGQ